SPTLFILFPYTTLFRSTSSSTSPHMTEWSEARKRYRACSRIARCEKSESQTSLSPCPVSTCGPYLKGQSMTNAVSMPLIDAMARSEEHTSELQSRLHLV